MEWMKQYCDSFNGGIVNNYNALERREACKGGKQAKQKEALSTTTRRHDPPIVNAGHKRARSVVPNNTVGSIRPVKTSAATTTTIGRLVLVGSVPPVSPTQIQSLNMQITILKLSVDSLEKERDFYAFTRESTNMIFDSSI